MINNYRVKPDLLSSGMGERLRPFLLEVLNIALDQKEVLEADHSKFIQEQQTRLQNLLSVLFSKQSSPVTQNVSNESSVPIHRETQRLQLEKLKPPTFDGDHTKWLLFKHKFNDIVVDGAGYSDTSQGHVLRGLVPKEALDRIEHLKQASEMFKVLDEVYGDVATSISILVNRLLSLRLTKSTEYDKMLELCTMINANGVLLTQLSPEAANHVKYNTNILAHLVELLPGAYEDKWFDYKVTQPSGDNEWDLFTKWLKDMEKRANAQKLSKLSKLTKTSTTYCTTCRSSSHSSSSCNRPRVSSHGTSLSDGGHEPEISACPLCNVHHFRGDKRSNIILDCPQWKSLSTVDEKARLVESMAGCKRCLRWDHKAGNDCTTDKGFYLVRDRINKSGKFTCGKLLANGQRCNADHSYYLCGTTVEYCCLTKLTMYPGGDMPDPVQDEVVLLPIQEVRVGSQKVLLFWDSGSTATLCTYQVAERLGLRGSPVTYSLQTVDSQGRVQKEGMVYTLTITTNEGVDHTVSAYGVESIASCHQSIKVEDSLIKLVPGLPSEVWRRPRGEIGILIGSNLTHLMPKDCYEVDNLRVRTSKFGSGYCLQGSSRAINLQSEGHRKVTNSAAQLEEISYAPGVRGARIQTMRVEVKRTILESPSKLNKCTCLSPSLKQSWRVSCPLDAARDASSVLSVVTGIRCY